MRKFTFFEIGNEGDQVITKIAESIYFMSGNDYFFDNRHVIQYALGGMFFNLMRVLENR